MAAVRRVGLVLVLLELIFMFCVAQNVNFGHGDNMMDRKLSDSLQRNQDLMREGKMLDRNINPAERRIQPEQPGARVKQNFGVNNPNQPGLNVNNMGRQAQPNVPQNFIEQQKNKLERLNAPGNGKMLPEAPENSPQKPKKSSASRIRLADTAACAADVKRLCSSTVSTNNFAVLECLQGDLKSETEVTVDCQHTIWQYKRNMSLDFRFDMANQEVCKDSLDALPECRALTRGKGLVIPCLLEHKENITGDSCKQFLTKMASIIFSDYRFISNFVEACNEDITNTRCGRLHSQGDDDEDAPHSQGHTLQCLSQQVDKLADTCKHQILRIAELQSEDFHEDRPLYYACRDDRERFCPKTKAGNGRVYRCLYRHKFEKDMSTGCRDQLVRRQRLTQRDYKVNKGLADACRQDLKTHQCLRGSPTETRHGKLSSILLCLEGAERDGKTVSPECLGEVREMRRSLMEDYKISPNIVKDCEAEIQNQCKGLERNGRTLHCLMDLARPERPQRGKFHAPKAPISTTCRVQLDALLKEADVGEDVRVDPYLMEACQPVMDTLCRNVQPGDAKMISCLMEHISSPKMKEECEERLIELQYFVARDFKMSPRLYQACRNDVNKVCPSKENQSINHHPLKDYHPLKVACIWSHRKQVSRQCEFEVRRIMRERAVSMDLEPRIEEPCLQDLGQFCSEDVNKGEEMNCLQDNMKELSQECRWAVGNFTQDVDEDPQLDRILMKSCAKPIKEFCQDLLDDQNTEPGDLMECLVTHKDSAHMDRKCRAGIEHHQLITLNDYRFSYKFKEACKDDVLVNCRNARKKSEVVRCLSEIVRNDTLLENDHRLSRPCRKQLRVELLTRSETIDLDPELKESCSDDVKTLCRNVSPGHAKIIECLKSKQEQLSNECRGKLFKREEIEAKDPGTSFRFVMDCKRMIKKYCRKENPNDLLKCLKDYKDENDFDDKCREAITNKMVVQNKDIRLNPELQAACKMDVNKFCKAELNMRTDHEMEGLIINCLKKQFPVHRLSKSCEAHIAENIREAAMDVRMDPVLNKACLAEIERYCAGRDAAGVEECLKEKVAKGSIMNKRCQEEVVRLLSESKVDIHIDPLLHKACALDLKHYCHDVDPGMGRQMSCMLLSLEDKTIRLRTDCRAMLEERVAMWEYAAKVAPPETFEELYQQVTTSKSKQYFILIFFSCIGFIFMFGLCCGRVTKRVRAELKNK